MATRRSTEQECRTIRENIEAVVRLEEGFDGNRSQVQRVADAIGRFAGSIPFVMLHVFVYGAWIIANSRVVPGLRPFDPFPFMLLSMVVSLEAIFLSTFVLIVQNRMSQRADQRAHLDLQINLLAEKEMTLMLQMLQRICTRLGVRPGEQVEELSEEISIEDLAEQLRAKLPVE